MTARYEHSETFSILKSTHEVIEGNLTSSQYLQTLDYFIWNAVTPIALECRPFFNAFIVKCVATQSLNLGTKYASAEKETLPSLLFNLCTVTRGEQALEHLKNMRLNRGVLFALITAFQGIVTDYQSLHSPLNDLSPSERASRMRLIEESVGCISGARLYSVVGIVDYWDRKARWFKGLIAQKYTRMALLQAQKTYVDFGHRIPLDDIAQVYLLVVNKAIDRCDSRLGVLTTFINRWLPTARSMAAKLLEHSESYENLSELNEESIVNNSTKPDTSYEDLQDLAYRAFKIDPVGIVRTSLGIPQYVTRQQRQLLLKYSI